MINGKRLVHKWQEKSLLHQPFVRSAHNLAECFQSGLRGNVDRQIFAV